MMSLARQERAFELGRAAKTANRTFGADDTVVGQARFTGVPQDIADGTRGTGPAGQRRDVAVGGDCARGNPCDHAQDSTAEERAGGQRTTASARTRPSARGRLMWLK